MDKFWEYNNQMPKKSLEGQRETIFRRTKKRRKKDKEEKKRQRRRERRTPGKTIYWRTKNNLGVKSRGKKIKKKLGKIQKFFTSLKESAS